MLSRLTVKVFFFQSFFGHTGSGRKLERFLRGR